MDDEEAAGAIGNEKPADKRAADVDAIRSKVRSAMSASVDEMLIPGLRATAVPILDIQARAALVVTVIATSAFDRRHDQAVVERLMQVCRTLTEKDRRPLDDEPEGGGFRSVKLIPAVPPTSALSATAAREAAGLAHADLLRGELHQHLLAGG
jgi:hypothetical protein